jgi:hypothetical protein
MRIISVRLEPVARVLSVVYAFFGLVRFLMFAFTGAEYITLPFGVVAPLIYLNFNLNLPRSTSLAYNIFIFFAAIISYAVSGWITGAAFVICFNIVANKMGGIDAKYVSAINEIHSSRIDN